MNALELHFNNALHWMQLDCITRDSGHQTYVINIDSSTWDSKSTTDRENEIWQSAKEQADCKVHEVCQTIYQDNGYHKHIDLCEVAQLSVADLRQRGWLLTEHAAHEMSFYDWWFDRGFDMHRNNLAVTSLLKDAQVRGDLSQEALVLILDGREFGADFIQEKLNEMLK